MLPHLCYYDNVWTMILVVCSFKIFHKSFLTIHSLLIETVDMGRDRGLVCLAASTIKLKAQSANPYQVSNVPGAFSWLHSAKLEQGVARGIICYMLYDSDDSQSAPLELHVHS